MGTKIYQTRKGERVELSSREVKSFILKQRGWTSKQYEKEYDKLRNRLRTYEAYQRTNGISVTPQSPASLLYFQSKAMKREGSNYQPTIELNRIYTIPSLSTGKTLTRRLEKGTLDFSEIYLEGTHQKFGGFIKANRGAQEIVDKIKNPVKLEAALTDYANKLYVKIKQYISDIETAAIPFGQAVGSDKAIDFDIEAYL